MSRLALYGIALAAVGALLWGWGHSRFMAGEKAAEARMQVQVAKANAKAVKDTQDAQDRADKLEKNLNEQITHLDDRLAAALARAPVVRVCPATNRSELQKTPANPPEHRDDTGAGRPDPEDGGDIAPELLRYARDAEALRLAVVACQDYGREIDEFRRQ